MPPPGNPPGGGKDDDDDCRSRQRNCRPTSTTRTTSTSRPPVTPTANTSVQTTPLPTTSPQASPTSSTRTTPSTAPSSGSGNKTTSGNNSSATDSTTASTSAETGARNHATAPTTTFASFVTTYGVTYGIDATGGSHSLPTPLPTGGDQNNNADPQGTANDPTRRSRIGAIVGGILGFIAFIVLATLCLKLIHRRQRRNRVPPSAAFLASLSSTRDNSFQRMSESVVDIHRPSGTGSPESRFRSDSPRSFLSMRDQSYP